MTEGYVTELDYTKSFCPDMAPEWLAFVANTLGFDAPSFAGHFRYLELGCGQGFTTNLLAAAHPRAAFVANDFNPRHIEVARKLAETACLTNVRFLEQSFEDLAAEGAELGTFDVIALHGVLSWVSPENERHILRILRERLKPGGLVYVGYNCFPGWAAVEPLRRLFLEEAARRTGALDERIAGAIHFARSLKDGMGYFTQTPLAALRLEESARRGSSYIAHEFFSRDWRPRYHLDVCAAFASVNLDYVGTTTLLRNTDAVVPESILPAFTRIEDRAWKEQVRDYVMNRQFRADVYARGARPLREHRQDVELCLAAAVDDFDYVVRVSPVELGLDRTIYGALFDVLRDGPLSIPEIVARAKGKVTEDDVREACILANGLLRPSTANHPSSETESSCARFNDAVVREALAGNEVHALASPVLGSGLPMTTADVLAFAAMNEGGPKNVGVRIERLHPLWKRLRISTS